MAMAFKEVQLRLAGLVGPALDDEIAKLRRELEDGLRNRYRNVPPGVPEHFAAVTLGQAIKLSRGWADGGIHIALSGEDPRIVGPGMATEDDVVAAATLDRDQGLDEE